MGTAQDVRVGALSIDWSSADTWIGVGGAVAGLAFGIGIPAFYMSIQSKDEERLEELRELNRQTYKETGQYLSEVRTPSFHSMSRSRVWSPGVVCWERAAACITSHLLAGGSSCFQIPTLD